MAERDQLTKANNRKTAQSEGTSDENVERLSSQKTETKPPKAKVTLRAQRLKRSKIPL